LSRFAPITSHLLARKGDASPSSVKAPLFWAREPAEPPPPPEPRVAAALREPAPVTVLGEKPHRMVITLSPAEFERLGIAAVKKNQTRHQVLRAALEAHLDRIKREYGGCGCTAGLCTAACGDD
jgi:predicted transcriptional regulator